VAPEAVVTPPVQAAAPVAAAPAAPAATTAAAPAPAADPGKTTEASSAKPASETPPAKPAAPEKYDLKVPENSLLESAQVEKLSAYAKQNGLSNEEAQALLDGESQAIATFVEERKTAWKTQAIVDPEIGGQHLNENVELAKRFIDRFGSPALKQELDKTGYGNHPEVVRLFVRLGKEMKEDKLIMPGAQSSSGAQRPIEEIFYGKQPTQ
jgi:hypothetical protein